MLMGVARRASPQPMLVTTTITEGGMMSKAAENVLTIADGLATNLVAVQVVILRRN
jgi:hypothetical protein